LLDKLEESDVMVYSVYYQTMMGMPPGRRQQRPMGGMGRGRVGGMGIPGFQAVAVGEEGVRTVDRMADPVPQNVKEEQTKMRLITWSR
jgi:hypothetical protein